MHTNSDKLLFLLSEIFQVNKSEINNNSSPQNTKTWDSFNTLKMVLELEKEFKITMPLEDVIEIKSVKDIKNLLISKGIDLDS